MLLLAPGSYGQSQTYGGFPGAPGLMGPPPGTGGAPGMSAPPGMTTAQSPQAGRPNGVPSQFQPPPNLPNINFNAPVIRMGMSQSKPATGYSFDDRRGGGDNIGGNRGRMGLGADSSRQNRTDTLQPPTKEEVARTMFVGGLVEGSPPDSVLEEILGSGRGLRRWTRVTDADGKACEFGFAEYDDASSLEIATKLFEDVELPLKEKSKTIKDEDGEVKKAKLKVAIDPESVNYIKQWTKPDENDFQFKLDTARDDLNALLATLSAAISTHGTAGADADGDATMEDGVQGDSAEVVTLPVSGEDELSDVPPEMREQVAAEIKAFRDRSIRRDLERLKKEEEMEKAERERDRSSRPSRLASPPVSAPTGPGGANGVPVGPRDRTVAGAPSGPRTTRGAQIPRDYVDGVAFVNGNDDEDDSASDEELENRRKEKRESELEKRYVEQERRWLQREKAHFSAVERQQKEEEAASAAKERSRRELAERLKDFDDEAERRKPTTLFYKDRRAWIRERRIVRGDEKRRDDHDRREEQREKDAEQRKLLAAQGMADDFLAQQADEIEARNARNRPAERQTFSLNLGGLGGLGGRVKREDEAEETKAGKNSGVADVEGLLDDEEDAAAAGVERKPLKAVEFKPLAPGEKMTDEERVEASRQLAASVPTDAAELFAWPVKWEHVSEGVIMDKVRPYAQKKIMEALGVQEDLLVDLIESILRRHGGPDELVRELEMLDDEAETLARRVWRMVVFYSESEARGLDV